ncbi:MAG TPA: sugar phosphate nucleotidyltransferase [Bacteroidales bacterium]|jgi:NDP-sugar pyrophosphorylase family protein|nr:nucleotidyltransferase [Bacteroidales bacterium]MBP7873569.1 nucleotidyltransferase [Bacteroidales bacterium]MCZ2282592.1 nucleotidyltransferase [Bacteroidales bacterium]HPX33688.1 sugar phosphate nucleotidyltransferase [Bacteroidales bacterium]HQB47498.1 sugar phosphate nucleotidyltransferase [Bacteroidales bacterium]
MKKPTLLILAAGIGSRYGGLKQIDKIGPSGEAIIDYSIFDAMRAGFGKVVMVIRKELEADFRDFFNDKIKGKLNIQYVYQELDNLPEGVVAPAGRVKPWGTAHAVLVASEVINEPFMVINADDFYGMEAYQSIVQYFTTNNNLKKHCMVGYQLQYTLSDHGTVSRGICSYGEDMILKGIREVTNVERRSDEIGYNHPKQGWSTIEDDTIVSMNAWGFYPGIFQLFKKGFADFITNADDILKAEYYIAKPLAWMIEKKLGDIQVLESDAKWFGVTYREDKELAKEKINKLINSGLYPENLWS